MKKFVVIVLLIVLGLALWFWWTHRNPSAEAPSEPAATTTVEVAPLAEQEIAETLEAFGVIVAAPSSEQVSVAAFDGIVRHVAVAPGARVAAGDVLVELSPSPDAQLALSSARSTAVMADKIRADTERRFELNLATRPDLQAAQQAAGEARLKVTSLEARGSGGDARVVAITSGVVSKLDAMAGSWVSAGTALATVTGENALEARLGLEPDDAARVAAGQNVTLVSVSRAGAEPVTTTVREVGRALDATTGAIEVRAAVPSGGRLLLGEHVRATIELQRKAALVVPRQALLPENGRQVFFTIQAGKAVRHEVQPGLTAGNLVEVRSAELQAGDQVVTLGNYELTDGAAVRVAPADVNATAGAPPAETKRP
jgi:RND family efflux transporter MFP subunit